MGIITFAAQPANGGGEKKKPVAGKADMLRRLPKKFGALHSYNAKANTVTIHFERDKKPTTWKLHPAAEIKILTWWGRLEQFQKGDRVYAWFAIDRNKQPTSVLMLADEISEQMIHNWRYDVAEQNERTLGLKPKRGKTRVVKLPEKFDLSSLKNGGPVFFQTAGGVAKTVWTEAQLEKAVAKQKDYLRDVWRKRGLPGMVGFAHPLSGEMEVMLDHEAMRWGRYLKNGDKVTLRTGDKTDAPIKAAVKSVQAWREFTRVQLATNSGLDQTELRPGERIAAFVPEPPDKVQQSPYPTDIGRLKDKNARMEWFLANTYCTCKVRGDRCTGMFFTLASCNVNACGMPNMLRKMVGEMIDKGMTDVQIMDNLLEKRGPELLRPHLLP